MDMDEAPSDAAPQSTSEADVNMQDDKLTTDAPGTENGVPEIGDKPVQMETDAKGVLGIKVKIMLDWDPKVKQGPSTPLPDLVTIHTPKEEEYKPVTVVTETIEVPVALIALKKGAELLKYGRKGKPKFCPFRLSNSYQKALRADHSYKPAAECLAIVLTDLGTSLKLAGNTRRAFRSIMKLLK